MVQLGSAVATAISTSAMCMVSSSLLVPRAVYRAEDDRTVVAWEGTQQIHFHQRGVFSNAGSAVVVRHSILHGLEDSRWFDDEDDPRRNDQHSQRTLTRSHVF